MINSSYFTDIESRLSEFSDQGKLKLFHLQLIMCLTFPRQCRYLKQEEEKI